MEMQRPEAKHVKRIYHQIIGLALAAHVSYVVIFTAMGLPALAAYNVASALFYCGMQLAVRRGRYRLAVSCTHVEVCVFVSVCTLAAGWNIGIALYLMAVTSLVYFCPFKHKYIPYLFAVMEVCVFLSLKLYTGIVRPGHLAVSEKAALWLYIYDTCACFAIILYAAFASKVSAAVGWQELKDENISLTALANYDQLTGFLSRHAFLARLEKLRGSSIILCLSDIDDFKKVNDTYGHACGDRVLSESAELIRGCLGGEADVCRWGGEEFVYLFRDMPAAEVLAKIKELCGAVEGHTFHHEGADLHITMTFGISPDSEELSGEELIALADKRMYQGKAAGKNRVICAGGSFEEKP